MMRLIKLFCPVSMRRWLRIQLFNFKAKPPILWLDFGSLRRLNPINRNFGFERGQPIDRYYIEKFLGEYVSDIKGDCLEVDDNVYTRKFGGSRVSHSDVLHLTAGNPRATIIADLSRADHIASDKFDCIILTQTLQYIYDIHSAIRHLYRILKPAGVLLATIPGISQISRYDMKQWGEYWRFSDFSARKLFGEVFGADNVTVEAYGNVLSACSFLYGISAEELKPGELDYKDPDYQLLITVRAVRRK